MQLNQTGNAAYSSITEMQINYDDNFFADFFNLIYCNDIKFQMQLNQTGNAAYLSIIKIQNNYYNNYFLADFCFQLNVL